MENFQQYIVYNTNGALIGQEHAYMRPQLSSIHNHNDNNILMPVVGTCLKTKKIKKFKRYENIKCVVCGDVSSGFHYGAYTCEACKLFFIRAEKQKREFNQCVHGNCYVNVEKRKSCASCRYKMCIASGMDLSRRKFGRHTTENHVINDREHQPNLISKLIKLYDQFNYNISKYLTQMDPTINFTAIINDYYFNSLAILSINDDLSLPLGGHTQLDEINFAHEDTSRNMMILTVYLTLFNDIQYFFENQIYFKFSNDLRKIIVHMNQQLCANEFSNKLKIMVFMYLINSMESKAKSNITISKKRLTDLIKSEFSQFKFNSTLTCNFGDGFVSGMADCAQPDDEKNSNQYAFNAFFLLIIECQVLINQYFNLIKYFV